MELVRRTWGSGAAGGAVGVVVRENCVNFTWQTWRLPRWCYTSVKLGCFSSHLVLAWEAAWFVGDVAEFILLTVLSLAFLRLEWGGAARIFFSVLNVKAELMYIWQTQALGGQDVYDFAFSLLHNSFLSQAGYSIQALLFLYRIWINVLPVLKITFADALKNLTNTCIKRRV